MAALLKLLQSLKSGRTTPPILVRLVTLATTFSGYWTVFQTHYQGAVKGPVGAAAIGLVMTWLHEEHTSARHTDTVSVEAMKAKMPAAQGPDIAALVESIFPKQSTTQNGG